MPAATTPIKVDEKTDQLATQAAHFLSTTKKDVVDRAIREYVDNHREEIHAGVLDALRHLDGSEAAAVSVLTGLSVDELDDLGGLPK
jgi:hypothetical protein